MIEDWPAVDRCAGSPAATCDYLGQLDSDSLVYTIAVQALSIRNALPSFEKENSTNLLDTAIAATEVGRLIRTLVRRPCVRVADRQRLL